MNTEELTITIKVDDKDASSKLDTLKQKIEDIESISRSKGFQHLTQVAHALENLARATDNMGSSVKHLRDLGDAATSFAQKVNNVKTGPIQEATNAIDSFRGAVDRWNKAGNLSGTFNINQKSASNIVSASRSAIDLGKSFKTAYKWGSKVAQIPFKMLFSPLKGVAAGVQSISSSFTGLLSKIGRVAFMRAIRGAVKMVTQALKEGVGAVYDWASAVGNGFVGTMNSITTSLTYLRNSIGAAISPILDAIAPILDAIVDKCVSVINVFNQLIATLTGASTWRKAEKVATSYGDAASNAAKNTGKANDAVKELKRTLLGFDEINRLDSADRSSGSGGSGSGSGSGATGAGALDFSEQRISESVKNFADMLRDAWDKGDFTNVGNLIGEKIGGMLLNVPWEEKIQPTVEKLATSFGSLLTGMFDYNGSGGKAMWDGIAYTVYNALNTAMLGYVTFFKTVNWVGIGQGVGAALKKALLDGIDWSLVSEALSAFPNAVIDAITGFNAQFTTEDFKSVGTAIGNAVATAIVNIKWKDFFQNSVLFARGILNAFNGALEGFAQNWSGIKSGIINGIKSVSPETWEGLGTDIGKAVFNTANFIWNVIDALIDALATADWNAMWKGFKEGLAKADWTGLVDKITTTLTKNIGTISIVLALMFSKFKIMQSAKTLTALVRGGSLSGAASAATFGSFLQNISLAAGILLLINGFSSIMTTPIGTLKENLISSLRNGFKVALGGALIGFALGGAAGAVAGGLIAFTLGASLTLWITEVLPKIDQEALDKGLSDYRNYEIQQSQEFLDSMDLNQGDVAYGPRGKQTYNTYTNDRRYGAANSVTYGSDTVTKAQTFTVMPDTSNSDQWWKSVQAAWDRIVSIHKASRFSVAGVINDSEEWWRQARTFWENKVSPGTTKAARFHVMGVVNESAEWWTQARTFWTNKVESGQKASRFHVAGVQNESAAWWDQLSTYWSTQSSKKSLTAKVKIGDLWNAFADAWNSLQGNFNKYTLTAFVNVKTKSSNVPKGATYTATGGIYKNGRWQDITKYAAGGAPSTGEIFIARESGPEMVGMLNGSTAVVNNDQIVSSIANGVFRAASAAFGSGQREPVNDITIKIDSETIYRVVKKGERIANGRYGTSVAVG